MEFNSNLEQAQKLKMQIDELQREYDACMEPVKAYAVEHPDEKIAGFGFKISATKQTETVSVDLKALEAAEPELYADLLKDYPKRTVRKAYARVSFDGR